MRQSAYEYVFNGVVSGNETLFREVTLAPIQARIVMGLGTFEVTQRRLFVPSTVTTEERSVSIERSVALLDQYFAPVTRVSHHRARKSAPDVMEEPRRVRSSAHHPHRPVAMYSSNYGHPFSRPSPLSRRFRDYGTYLRPPWLRRYTFRIRNRVRQPLDWQGYLARAYRDAILPCGP